VSLEQSQFDAVHLLVPNRAFTITTGDIVEGAVCKTTNHEIVYDVADAYTRMARTLGQVYPAIGNHDAVSDHTSALRTGLTCGDSEPCQQLPSSWRRNQLLQSLRLRYSRRSLGALDRPKCRFSGGQQSWLLYYQAWQSPNHLHQYHVLGGRELVS